MLCEFICVFMLIVLFFLLTLSLGLRNTHSVTNFFGFLKIKALSNGNISDTTAVFLEVSHWNLTRIPAVSRQRAEIFSF